MQRDMIEALAPDFPYIVIINEADTVTDAIASRKVNFVGVETVFKTEQSPVGTDAYREKARAHDWLLWGNSIPLRALPRTAGAGWPRRASI